MRSILLRQNRFIRSPHRLFSTDGGRRIRVISCDVTGTLVSFLGKIEENYGKAAHICGVELPPHQIESIGKCFNKAYKETSISHPCFGNHMISAKDWWRRCVNRSFELVGTDLSASEQEMVFQRIYSKFGIHATCKYT